MLKHPLQLRRSALVEFSLSTTEDFDRANAGYTIHASPGLQHSDELRSWLITLVLEVGPNEEGKAPPYRLRVGMTGEFEWHGDRSRPGEVAKAVSVSACSILYGQMRELILLLTNRGLNPGFQLPSVSFADLNPELPTESTEAGEEIAEPAPAALAPASVRSAATPHRNRAKVSRVRKPSKRKR